jgi:hypothetical protein
MDINVKNKSKWKQDGYYVGRPTVLGNPFRIDEHTTREISIQRYAEWFISKIRSRNSVIIQHLHLMEKIIQDEGKLNLVCWCAPKMCHADLIKQALLNKIHTNYWLVKDICPTCGHGQYKIGVHGL